ncbi:MAG: O-methyltransferase [Gemmatimonadaceae bacterium]
MTELWTAVDKYLDEQVVGEDADLAAATEATVRAGLPQISVTPTQGKLLYLLARAIGARAILELGTLAGYSTIWLGRAVAQDGRVISLELDPAHAKVARENIARAGLEETVDIRVGAALEILPGLADEGPFDFVFIDADKPNVPEYFEWAIRLSRPGAIIIVDNVVRDGRVVDAESTDPSVLGVRRLHEQLPGDDRVTATTIQTVGAKGHDGFTIALVNPRMS